MSREWGEEERYGLLVESPEGTRPLGRPNTVRCIILRQILERKNLADVEWIVLTKDKDKWRALVNAVMNLLVS
jgi:hypothetical protein